jgi:hypothetical protein
MGIKIGHLGSVATFGALLVALCAAAQLSAQKRGGGGGGGGHTEIAGNNLSFPVIWAEGVTKALRGAPGVEQFDGVWWYWWGTDDVGDPLSCGPDTEDPVYCEDGDDNPDTLPTVFPGEGSEQVYQQQDFDNEWQAESANWSAYPVDVNWIDWGDNLESVDWYTRSQVRTEVVLIQDLATPLSGYEMRHLYGLGIDEMHGTTGLPYDSHEATVYSHCARLTIQKLKVPRENEDLVNLDWVPQEGWADGDFDLINEPIFNMAVYNAGDGPGYYSAEINVKGKVIYGYTWNVRKLNEGPGDYRITFSFDQACGAVSLNTHFTEGVTQILLPTEEELVAAEEREPETGGGAVGVLDFAHNLTYMDVRILERGGGGGKKK